MTNGLDGTPSSGKQSAIRVRNLRFGRESASERPVERWWAGGDPIATAWFNALSSTFPRGETLFIDSVKAFRGGAPPALAEKIRAFIMQEVNHTREHLAFNRAAEAAGYDLAGIDARVERLVGEVYAHPQIAWLGVTVALEHFTAMFAHEFLSAERRYALGEGEQAALWRWHAAEEIEHKGVAFDTWSHATRGWSGGKRWRLRSTLMLATTRKFLKNRFADALELLAQDGITGARAKARLAWYLVGRPGILRRTLPMWLSYFRPGFHPWQHDDSALVRLYDGKAAALAAEPALAR